MFPDLKPPRIASLADVSRRRFQSRFDVESGIDTARYMGWSVIPAGVRNGLLKEWQWVRCGELLARAYLVRHGRPDIIHAHTLIAGGALASVLASRWTIPWVYTEHSVEWMEPDTAPLRVAYAKRVASSAAHGYAVSRALLAGMERYGVASAVPMSVMPNAIDCEWFTLPPEPVRKDRAYRFVYVGNVNTILKRTDLLLRSFKSVAVRCQNAELHVVGEGDERTQLQAMAETMGIGDRVVWHGYLQRQALRRVLWDADALVHPSRRETFGLAAAEALSTGLAVVAVASGGIEDIVNAELCGLGCALVPVDGEDELAREMMRAVSNGPSSKETRQRRRDSIVRRFGMAGIAAGYITRYYQILGF